MVNEVIFECKKLGKSLKGYDNGDPRNTLFDATYICNQLEYSNASVAIARHVWPQYKTTIRGFKASNGQLKPLLTIGGVMQLIMQSKQPWAVEFQDWVYSELLPQVMFGGKYIADEALLKKVETMHKVIEIQQETINGMMRDMNKVVDDWSKPATNLVLLSLGDNLFDKKL